MDVKQRLENGLMRLNADYGVVSRQIEALEIQKAQLLENIKMQEGGLQSLAEEVQEADGANEPDGVIAREN